MSAENYTLITGASSGIGRAIAIRFSAERRLILHGRDVARLEETRSLCRGTDHLVWPCELAAVETISPSLTAFLAGQQRGVECFIHSAGMVTLLPARSASHETARKILNVNFLAAVEIMAVLLKKRVNQQHLRTALFLSSIFSLHGARYHSLYCASKGALDSYMRALAVELAPSVRVNSLVLGGIKTRMAASVLANPETAASLEKQYPLGLGAVEDPAEAAAFLVSEKARWITGQQIVVDGGRTADMSPS